MEIRIICNGINLFEGQIINLESRIDEICDSEFVELRKETKGQLLEYSVAEENTASLRKTVADKIAILRSVLGCSAIKCTFDKDLQVASTATSRDVETKWKMKFPELAPTTLELIVTGEMKLRKEAAKLNEFLREHGIKSVELQVYNSGWNPKKKNNESEN